MKNILTLLAVLMLVSCNNTPEKKHKYYGWEGEGGNATEQSIKQYFTDMKGHGLDGIMYNVGFDTTRIKRASKLAKEVGLEYHAWIPTLLNGGTNELITENMYVVNRNGESSFTNPAYVGYYKFLCPNHEEVFQYVSNMYQTVARIPDVDGVHLDYIRFPDVILARGLWDKYGLVMDQEYPQFDYCYCEKCVADFKTKTGIDILTVEDASAVPEWKQFRYDLLTNFVNRLADSIHAEGKQISAAVFPGPESIAQKIVRQEWDKWNLDAVYPMNYNDFYLEDTTWVGTIVKEEVESVNNKRPIYSGLFICPSPDNKAKEKDPENHGLVPIELGAAIKQSLDNGAAGVCLFTPGRMTDAHWAVFNETIKEAK